MMNHNARAGMRLDQLSMELSRALDSDDEAAVCRISELLPKAVDATLQKGVSGRLPDYRTLDEAVRVFDRAEEFLTRRMHQVSMSLGVVSSGKAVRKAYSARAA